MTFILPPPYAGIFPSRRNGGGPDTVESRLAALVPTSVGCCCLTGTVSSVFTQTPFRFPMVKYTRLPSLEAGFLQYAPMKTEAPS